MTYKNKISRSNFWVIAITIVLLVLVIMVIAAIEKKQESSKNSELSQLQTIENSYDFGTISMANGVVTKNFTVKNDTAKSIEIEKLYTSCMCTKASLIKDGKTFGPFSMSGNSFGPKLKADIKPGEEAQVEVVFDPAAHGPAGVGPIGRAVTLETSDGELIFKFKAQVTP